MISMHDTEANSAGNSKDLSVCALTVSESSALSRNDEFELGWAIRNDNCHASRTRLVDAHSPLVSLIASKFSGCGAPLSQLRELGDIGLLRAVEHFDPAQGARFSTLASWWIKQSIKHGLRSAKECQETPCRRDIGTDHLMPPDAKPIERVPQHPKAFARQGEM